MKIFILIISYKSLPKLEKCINSIGKNRKILIIENSNNFEIKKIIEKKFDNCNVTVNGKNLGYGAAANIGFSKIENQFVLLLNTDTIIEENQISEIENEIQKGGDDFALASPIYDDLIDFSQNNQFDKKLLKQDVNFNEDISRTKIEIIKGCSLIINFKKFKDKFIFDDNFFFFFEEIDLCKKIKNMKENIFIFNKIKIKHENTDSVGAEDKKIYDNFRNWNYYWSSYYYHKKHYGLLSSITKHLSKLFRFLISALFFYLFSDTKHRTNKFRFYGLVSSILGIKSSNSDKILNKINS